MTMRTRQLLCLLLVLEASIAAAPRQTQTFRSSSRIVSGDSQLSRTAKQSVVLSVQASATGTSTQDSLYEYSYSLTNEPTSTNHLAYFGIRPIKKPVTIASPPGWVAVHGFEGDSTTVVWAVVAESPPPAGWKGNDVYVTPFHPAPGQTVTGFKIRSHQPPINTLSFYAEGFDTIPEGAHKGLNITIPTLYQSGVTGPILGPDFNSVVGVGDPKPIAEVSFAQPAPNPASGLITFSFQLPQAANVQVTVHDIAGRRIRRLADGQWPAGIHSLTWNGLSDAGQAVQPGVYFSKLVVDGRNVGQRRITVLK